MNAADPQGVPLTNYPSNRLQTDTRYSNSTSRSESTVPIGLANVKTPDRVAEKKNPTARGSLLP